MIQVGDPRLGSSSHPSHREAGRCLGGLGGLGGRLRLRSPRRAGGIVWGKGGGGGRPGWGGIWGLEFDERDERGCGCACMPAPWPPRTRGTATPAGMDGPGRGRARPPPLQGFVLARPGLPDREPVAPGGAPGRACLARPEPPNVSPSGHRN